MSRSYAAEQYEQDFLPRRLGNWEVPRAATAGPISRRPQARTGPTQPVVDARGHLLPGVPRRNTAFVLSNNIWRHSSARWPQARALSPGNAAYSVGAKATMGYKGIVTGYLPINTVKVLTVLAPGSRERLFR